MNECNAGKGRRHSASSAGVRASSDVSSLPVGEGSFTRSHGLRIDRADDVWVPAGLWFRLKGGGSPEVPLVAVPLTSYAGEESWPTLSPDGTQVAFSWNGERQDKWDIYVKQIGVEPPFRLTSDAAIDGSPA
jgi:hypothetical protein